MTRSVFFFAGAGKKASDPECQFYYRLPGFWVATIAVAGVLVLGGLAIFICYGVRRYRRSVSLLYKTPA